MNFRDQNLVNKNKLFFVRHNINFYTDENYTKIDKHRTEQALTEAWNKNFVLIDYGEFKDIETAYNPASYKISKSAQSCIVRFNNFLTEGGFIVIASSATNPGQLKAGWVAPNTKPRLISTEINETYCFKGVELTPSSIEIFDISTAPGLFSAIPRQLTFCEWGSGKRQFELSYLKIKPSDLKITDFHHRQLEVLCMEYLRTFLPDEKNRLSKLMMPIGGSLANVDIVGIDVSGNEILAQVTFHEEEAGKIDKLLSAITSNLSKQIRNGYYFGNIKADHKNNDGICYVNINEVLDMFVKNEKSYLYKMLGF